MAECDAALEGLLHEEDGERRGAERAGVPGERLRLGRPAAERTAEATGDHRDGEERQQPQEARGGRDRDRRLVPAEVPVHPVRGPQRPVDEGVRREGADDGGRESADELHGLPKDSRVPAGRQAGTSNTSALRAEPEPGSSQRDDP